MIAMECRHTCVQYLLNTPSFHNRIVAEVKDALSMGSSGNRTTKTVVDLLRRRVLCSGASSSHASSTSSATAPSTSPSPSTSTTPSLSSSSSPASTTVVTPSTSSAPLSSSAATSSTTGSKTAASSSASSSQSTSAATSSSSSSSSSLTLVEMTADMVTTKDAVDTYCEVMASDGLFGTELEVEALSEALKTPIHVYYRAADDQPAGPARVVGARFIDQNPPICLAFYMGQQHYKLIFPRAPLEYVEATKRGEAFVMHKPPMSSSSATSQSAHSTASASNKDSKESKTEHKDKQPDSKENKSTASSSSSSASSSETKSSTPSSSSPDHKAATSTVASSTSLSAKPVKIDIKIVGPTTIKEMQSIEINPCDTIETSIVHPIREQLKQVKQADEYKWFVIIRAASGLAVPTSVKPIDMGTPAFSAGEKFICVCRKDAPASNIPT
eukprot:TRINITY_DN145_c5_g1_i1.p1 TRINITY_DN145_c5_g1~~TRINITY_DN145_c5_g1_i1.p1  ORF type:complete len:489 (-),score=203.86 TRINITY_DN145_c5_g1_i1:71-1396(-)